MPAPGGNCTIRVLKHIETHPERMALWSMRQGQVTFKDVAQRAGFQQKQLSLCGIVPGDTVVVMALPSPDLYATLLALMGMGCPVVFVEPWMTVQNIDRALAVLSVKALLADGFGRLWRLKSPALRRLPCLPVATTQPHGREEFRVIPVDPEQAAIISFTSGTTGAAKGVVRSHKYLWDLHEILVKYGGDNQLSGPDLAVFPNVALFHLGTGRGSLLVPPTWSVTALQRMHELDRSLWPQSLSCGPAFLKHLLDFNLQFPSFRTVHVGGAMIECDLLERALSALPRAHVKQVYGGTEVEPIAFVDARTSLNHSRSKGYVHALNVGLPISEIKTQWDEQGILWVSGPNVCPEYLGNPQETALNKRREEDGTLWHCTGDRILQDENGLWFAGRRQQSFEDFLAEQKIYAKLGHSRAFIRRDSHKNPLIIADDGVRHVASVAGEVLGRTVPVWNAFIVRDKRHRSRIDRTNTWERGLRMLRFWTYMKERSPLAVLIVLASGPIVSGYLMKSVFLNCSALPVGKCFDVRGNLIFGLSALLASVAFLVEARLMDELKDLEKDKQANPGRPLPRGLLSVREVEKAILVLLLLLFFTALIFHLFAGATLAAGLLAFSTGYLWLMYKEFYVGQWLAKFPLLYALSHQLVGIPLYMFGLILFAPALVSHPMAWAFVGINVFASLTYEFSRKLKPDSHPAALTYRQIYGLGKSSLIALAFQLCAMGVSLYAARSMKAVAALIFLQAATATLIAVHGVRDNLHKAVEGFAALLMLVSAWLGLFLLLRW